MNFKKFNFNNLCFNNRSEYLCINKFKNKKFLSRTIFVNCRFFFDFFKIELKKHVDFFAMQNVRKLNYIRRLVGKKIFVMFYYPIVGKYTKFHFRKFVGKCIAFKRPGTNTAVIILRNTFNRYPLEFKLFLYSPFLVKFGIFENKNPFFRLNSKKKLYYLRKK
jgi:ribosomal protein L19